MMESERLIDTYKQTIPKLLNSMKEMSKAGQTYSASLKQFSLDLSQTA